MIVCRSNRRQDPRHLLGRENCCDVGAISCKVHVGHGRWQPGCDEAAVCETSYQCHLFNRAALFDAVVKSYPGCGIRHALSVLPDMTQ